MEKNFYKYVKHLTMEKINLLIIDVLIDVKDEQFTDELIDNCHLIGIQGDFIEIFKKNENSRLEFAKVLTDYMCDGYNMLNEFPQSQSKEYYTYGLLLILDKLTENLIAKIEKFIDIEYKDNSKFISELSKSDKTIIDGLKNPFTVRKPILPDNFDPYKIQPPKPFLGDYPYTGSGSPITDPYKIRYTTSTSDFSGATTTSIPQAQTTNQTCCGGVCGCDKKSEINFLIDETGIDIIHKNASSIPKLDSKQLVAKYGINNKI